MLTTLVLAALVQVPAADGNEVKVLARGFWRADAKGEVGGGQQQLVLRSAGDLLSASGMAGKAADEALQKQVTAATAKLLKVDGIDWKKQMLVVVTGGVQPTGGYAVEVTKAEVKDKVLTVHWKLNAPKPGALVTQALTHPGQVALLERFEGEVKFDPPAKKADGKEK